MPSNSNHRDPLSSIGIEILEVLLSAHYLRDASDARHFSTPQDSMRTIHFVGLLWNDLILRLGKLREDDNRNWSFREVAKYLSKRATSASRSAAAKPKIDRYIEATKSLEIYRNRAVAHLTKQGCNDLRPLFEIIEIIRQAVEIGDLLSGDKTGYNADETNLRQSVLNEGDAQ